MFTLSPTGLPAGPVLDLVLLLFFSLAPCCWEPSTSSELPNSPNSPVSRPVSCREKKLERGWHTVSGKAREEERDLWHVRRQNQGQGARTGRKAGQSRHCDWPRCCYVTRGSLMPFLRFVSSNQGRCPSL